MGVGMGGVYTGEGVGLRLLMAWGLREVPTLPEAAGVVRCFCEGLFGGEALAVGDDLAEFGVAGDEGKEGGGEGADGVEFSAGVAFGVGDEVAREAGFADVAGGEELVIGVEHDCPSREWSAVSGQWSVVSLEV